MPAGVRGFGRITPFFVCWALRFPSRLSSALCPLPVSPLSYLLSPVPSQGTKVGGSAPPVCRLWKGACEKMGFLLVSSVLDQILCKNSHTLLLVSWILFLNTTDHNAWRHLPPPKKKKPHRKKHLETWQWSVSWYPAPAHYAERCQLTLTCWSCRQSARASVFLHLGCLVPWDLVLKNV